MPLISVIVPVYKVESYLPRCVDSILSQSMTDFELILVDDGSPDHCGELCDEYAKKDSRVHVIHQVNGGLSAARNAGLDWVFINSDSKWLSFVDSDDWVQPNYLEALYEAAKREKVDISICGFVKTLGDAIPKSDVITESKQPTEQFYIEKTINATIVCGKLYKKECFQNIRFPVGKIHEDEFVTYKILFHYEYVAVIDQPLYVYFQNSDGIMHRVWNPQRMAAFDAAEEQIDYFLDHHYENVAKIRFRYTAGNFIKHMKTISESATLSQKEKEDYKKLVRKRFQEFLLKYKKYQWMSPWKSRENYKIYAEAFPTAMIILKSGRFIKAALKHEPNFR